MLRLDALHEAPSHVRSMHYAMNYKLLFSVLAVAVAPLAAQEQPRAWATATLSGEVPTRLSLVTRGLDAGGPAVTGQPYSAEATTETVQTLSDGNAIRRNSNVVVYRDSEGRTRREEGSAESAAVYITDPVAGVRYILRPATKTAQLLPVSAFTATPYAGGTLTRRMSAPTAGQQQRFVLSGAPPRDGLPRVRSEELGERFIEGVEVQGTMLITTLDAETLGADRDVEISFERWYSQELGVDLMTVRNDPRRGKTTYRLTNINRSEPSRTFFEPPADYTIDTETRGGAFFRPQQFELPH
jgi:hypothetical protein